ncbi:amidohydrolase [Cellulomonas sp. KRMCY2]|uniref:amidohydrolase n=1 Tax=Cellulomonas sp. KRMCY2 TaxID=1304865 RepID=UPI00045E6F5D|nr:amidohydrolase family protein [Cellulomonas sp. KRMCY2]
MREAHRSEDDDGAAHGRPVLLRGGRLVDASGGRSGEPVDVHLVAGRVAAIGPQLTASPGDDVVHLDGRWVVPGLWDAHTHMTQWALARRRLDVSTATSATRAASLVTERLRADPPPAGLPLIGFGFRDGLWSDEPTARLLDDAADAAHRPDVPVVLVSGDLHCGWLSTAAARSFGVATDPGASPDGSGLVRERQWFAVIDRLGEAPDDVLDGWVAEAVAAAAARGVVGVVDFEAAGGIDVWARRSAGGPLGLRVQAAVWPDGLGAIVARGVRSDDVVPGTAGLVTMGSLKIITDGSLNTRTACCADPYPGLTGPGATGVLSVPPDELRALMRRAAAAGLTCAVHAIGDRANTLALDAFDATRARGSIEHAQLLAPRDVGRMAALGVVASVQPEHALDDRDVADRYWAGRTDRAFVFRSLHEAGVRLALGSDAPVAPLDPWQAIGAAVERTRDARPAWHPEQRIPVEVALRATTGGRSVVAGGDLADLAVLDADPLTRHGVDLRTMPVAATMLDGRWTHRTV